MSVTVNISPSGFLEGTLEGVDSNFSTYASGNGVDGFKAQLLEAMTAANVTMSDMETGLAKHHDSGAVTFYFERDSEPLRLIFEDMGNPTDGHSFELETDRSDEVFPEDVWEEHDLDSTFSTIARDVWIARECIMAYLYETVREATETAMKNYFFA